MAGRQVYWVILQKGRVRVSVRIKGFWMSRFWLYWQAIQESIQEHTKGTHTHTQPFYGSLNFVWDNLGEPVPEGAVRHLLDFSWSKMKITQADAQTIWWTATPSRLTGVLTSAIPTIFKQHALPSQPSQFILAWDRHQICWFAYPVGWLTYIHTYKKAKQFLKCTMLLRR